MFTLLFLLAGTLAAIEELPTIQIPRVDGLTVDGRANDWRGRGYTARFLDPGDQDLPLRADFVPRMRLAWSQDGIYVLVVVTDSGPRGVYLSDTPEVPDSRDGIECRIGSGADLRTIRIQLPEEEGPQHPRVTVEPAASAPIAVGVADDGAGYCIEFRIDAALLPRVPIVGEEVLLTLEVEDLDPSGHFLATFPGRLYGDGGFAPTARLRLTVTGSPGLDRLAIVTHDDFLSARVSVYGDMTLDGKAVVLHREAMALGEGTLRPERDRATWHQTLPLSALTAGFAVMVDGQSCPTLWPDLATDRRWILREMEYEARPACFGTSTLPPLEPCQRHRFQHVLGDYTVTTTYLDGLYRPVRKADHGGRYGAVMTFRWSGGESVRYCSLFRMSDPADPLQWRRGLRLDPELPDFLGFGRDPHCHRHGWRPAPPAGRGRGDADDEPAGGRAHRRPGGGSATGLLCR